MARLRYNGLSATLGASLTTTATAVTFGAALTHSNGTAVPTIASPNYVPLAILNSSGHLSEIVWLTAYTSGGTTGTIARGKEGTTGVVHSSGDVVACATTVRDTGPGWFNVIDYGAFGDNSADDTSAINAAIAALNSAGRGVLYFPAGNYKITSDLTTISAHATILGDGAGDLQAQNAASTITYASATGTALTLTGDGTIVRDLALENSTALTHTAGAGIKVTQGDLNRYINVSVRGFYDCVDIEDGALWEMHSCYLVGPKRYGLYIRHIDLVDGGDMVIVGGGIYAEDRDGSAAIRQESGGGLRVLGTKINTLYDTGHFAYGVDATITNAATSNLLLSGMSIENVTTNCVRVTHAGTGSFGHVILQGVETAQYQTGSTSAIDISNVSLVSLDGLIMVANPSRSTPAITLTSVTTANLGRRMQTGYSADYTATSSTGISDLVPPTRALTAGTGLTGGGDLSADRSFAIDTTAEAERIRDVIGAALVAGSGVTILVDDPSDTITISSSGGGGGGGGTIAYLVRDPSSLTTYGPFTTNSETDVDATNLAVTFTAPSSGKVKVVLEATANFVQTSASQGNWCLREGSTLIDSLYMAGKGSGTFDTGNARMRCSFVVTGLTSGSSHTYKWAWRAYPSGTWTMYAGSADVGMATMEVVALP